MVHRLEVSYILFIRIFKIYFIETYFTPSSSLTSLSASISTLTYFKFVNLADNDVKYTSITLHGLPLIKDNIYVKSFLV